MFMMQVVKLSHDIDNVLQEKWSTNHVLNSGDGIAMLFLGYIEFDSKCKLFTPWQIGLQLGLHKYTTF